MIVHLGPAQAARVKLLQKELRQLSGVTAPAGVPRDESSAAARLQTELDDTVATECPLCGEVMIESVGQPFLDDAERTSSEWDI